MTLIIGTLNRRYAIQVSDRRTTSSRGVESDEVTKALVLTCNDGRFALGYTGLAEAGTFNTRTWLIQALMQCGPPDFTARMIVWRLTEMLSADFARIAAVARLAARDKRLTLMFTGFIALPDGSAPSVVFVSNFQDFDTRTDSAAAWPRFRIFPMIADAGTSPFVDVQRIGAFHEIGPREWRPLMEMLQNNVPAEALVGKMVDLIREAAKRISAGGTIGRHALSCVIPSDFSAAVTSGFYSATVGHVLYMADSVVVTSGMVASAIGMQLAAADPANSPPLVVPKQPRNQPCACRSGKKYKDCHGR